MNELLGSCDRNRAAALLVFHNDLDLATVNPAARVHVVVDHLGTVDRRPPPLSGGPRQGTEHSDLDGCVGDPCAVIGQRCTTGEHDAGARKCNQLR